MSYNDMLPEIFEEEHVLMSATNFKIYQENMTNCWMDVEQICAMAKCSTKLT